MEGEEAAKNLSYGERSATLNPNLELSQRCEAPTWPTKSQLKPPGVTLDRSLIVHVSGSSAGGHQNVGLGR